MLRARRRRRALSMTVLAIKDITAPRRCRLLSMNGIGLRSGLLQEVERWFSETLYTEEKRREIDRELAAEADLGIGLPPELPLVARLLARVTGQIRTGKTIKSEIRHQLDPQVTQLLQNIKPSAPFRRWWRHTAA